MSPSNDEVCCAMYKKIEKLGEGTYGVVYRAVNQLTGEFVAIKKIKLDQSDEGMPATTLREISVLKQLRHPCIVHLQHAEYGDEGRLFLIFEFLERDMKVYLDSLIDAPSPLIIKKLMYQLVSGLHHCHRRRILHRDLKPQNLLIGKNDVLKIADFGLGREHGLPIESFTHEVVTLWYRAPEILLGAEKYSGAIDMWSVGCIFGEFYKKEALFMGDCEIDQLYQIFRGLGTANESNWPGVSTHKEFKLVFPKWERKEVTQLVPAMDPCALDLFEKFLTYHPGLRLTAAAAKAHRYFDEIRHLYDFP